MKKLFGRLIGSSKETGDAGDPQPRLLGETEPYYSPSAKRAFAEVLTKARGVEMSSHGEADQKDAIRSLEDAVEVASLYCNDELLRRAHTFQAAVLACGRGEASGVEMGTARENFTLGCRLALGTDT
jgi:hypothetical protein